MGGPCRDDGRQPSLHRSPSSIPAPLVRPGLWRQRDDLRLPGGSPAAGAVAGSEVPRSRVVRVRPSAQQAMSDFDHSIVESTAHRPWPMPRGPWLMTQTWHDLLFAHWRVDVSELRRAVPPAFDLDLFDGEAWVGVVPFHMTNVGLRATPAVPWISAFPELNVRTYVRVADRPGVYFFSLDAARWLAVAAARTLLNLPYYTADMTLERRGDAVRYESVRRTRPGAQFKATYEPVGGPFAPPAGSIEYFLTERYCL